MYEKCEKQFCFNFTVTLVVKPNMNISNSFICSSPYLYEPIHICHLIQTSSIARMSTKIPENPLQTFQIAAQNLKMFQKS